MTNKKGQARDEATRARTRDPRAIPLRGLTTGLFFSTLLACGGGGGGGSVAVGAGSAPQLSVASLTFSPSQANVGETIHVVDIVLNSGGSAATNFQVAVYLSLDSIVSPSDTLIGLRSVPTLAPGQSSTGGGFLTIPTTLAQGEWFVGCIVDSAGSVAESNEGDNSSVAVQTLSVSSSPAPDLLPTQVTFDLGTIEAGDMIGVTDRIENIGVGSAGSFQVGVYLSEDSDITTGDVLLGLRNVNSLDPGEISFNSSSLTVPLNVEAGLWFLGAIADMGGTQPESDEFNNSLAAAGTLLVTQPPRPDLRMVSLDFSPNLLNAGESIQIVESVLNQGLVAAGPFRVGVFLSTDAEITSADHLLGFRSLGGLNVGESSLVAAPLVIPASVGAGTFYVGAIADHEELLLESDENNNAILALGTVQLTVPPLPDLQTVAVAFSPNVAETGDQVTIIERVTNTGTAGAANFRVGIYLSSNPSVTTADVLLGSRVIASLPVGSEDESLSQYTLPNGLGTGSWTVGVIVDDLFELQEPEEGNNLLVASGFLDITGSVDPLPDLVFGTLTAAPNQVLEGGMLTVQSIIRNEGDLSAETFDVRFYLSTDETIDPGDHLVGTRTIFGLGIGGGSAQSFPYTLDPGLALGEYTFGGIIDLQNQVLESDEENNIQSTPGNIEIYVPPPPAADLTVTAFSFTPGYVQALETVQFSYTVKNVGDLAAGAHHVDFYASTDSEIDATEDIWIGAGLAAALLAPGAESPSVIQLDLPAAVTTGIWHIGAIVTVDSGPVDENETNDLFVATTTLEVAP